MPNRLAAATSPYLRQHADNPVDWHPWSEEALTLSKSENKPILLSIGYSACHWCHVMAHESFEDPAVAAAMNSAFVNIKVDREERPDLDQIYQMSHALMTRRSGGWPLTIFLTPDGIPFFAGTYFPKESRYGMPGFLDLLPRVAAAYHERGPAVAEQGERLSRAMQMLEPGVSAGPLPRDASRRALAGLKDRFDRVDGGFGEAPKFPHAAELDFCLRAWTLHADDDAQPIVETTLQRMAAGGIHDQLGGGFCRYSVDAQWSIPHFEKMLYDNAALLALYADAARATANPAYGDVARGIVGWLVREMRSADGAFYSSLDADSEGEEGRFYVWTREQVRAVLRDDEWQVAAPHYGLDGPPNFEGHAWNLRVVASVDEIAARFSLSLPDVQTRLAGARMALFKARDERVRPGRDDKILTSWNALMIAALARAARALDQPKWADLAFTALDTLVRTAWRDGRLYATRHGDDVALDAYLDDHAFLLAALLEAMQTRFRRQDYDLAVRMADVLLDRFEDRERGGFWFTSHDHERLFHRTKPAHDNATPSGNGVAAQALIALGHLAAQPRYVEAAERTVKLFAVGLVESPGSQSTLLVALERLLAPPSTVVLAGDADETHAWQRALEQTLRPDVVAVDLAGADVPDALRKGAVPAGGAAAWVCRGMRCLPPLTAYEAIPAALAEP
ncbi:MAG TPA: thioredoxin domain-containing protein [Casimicrobiaceae bacterium]|nr:thioredoxin domain-containing protein [Casimicrobiaceae bacterium]